MTTSADLLYAEAQSSLSVARGYWNNVSGPFQQAQRATPATTCAGTLDASYASQLQAASSGACRAATYAVQAAQAYAAECAGARAAAAGAKQCPGLDLSEEQSQGTPWGVIWNGYANCLDPNLVGQVGAQLSAAAASVAAAGAAQTAAQACARPVLRVATPWRIGMLGDFGDYGTAPGGEDSARRAANCFYTSMMGLSGAGNDCGCGGRAGCKCVEGKGFPCNCARPQGPTDHKHRCFACWWVEQLGLGDQGLSYGGRPVQGFGAPQPTDVYSSLTAQQQTWVQQALTAWLADQTVETWISSNPCQGVTAGMVLSNTTALYAVIPCFQSWFNTQASQGGSINAQGILDQTTLAALMATVAQATWGSSVGSCPGSCGITPSSSSTPASSSSSSSAWWIVGGVAAVGLIGGLIYVMRPHRAAA